MRNKAIERGWIDLDAAPRDTSKIIHLTDAAEPRWVGIVDLGPSETYALDAGYRNDLYVLQGHVDVDAHALDADDFLIQCDSTLVHADKGGARLLVYREASESACEPTVRSARERVWRDGINPRMQVAPLAGGGQKVSLVAWRPGARTIDHPHPRGEEIFVLNGELRDGEERYPAGTWLRLHPGVRHAPFAEAPTTILLRHGHLQSACE
jgi:quercetin dioxygenase-like cupin family protein